MFDFMDEDWFVIGLEIVFLVLISYDVWKYFKTRKKEYIINIAMAIGFAVWVLYPFYTKYYMWEAQEREGLIQTCLKEHNASYCNCVDDKIFKAYDVKSYTAIDKEHDKAFLTFMQESEQECFEQ